MDQQEKNSPNVPRSNSASSSSSDSLKDNAPVNNPFMTEDLKDDLKNIKGDMIGETIYSQRWVLRTLMTMTEKFPEYCVDASTQLDKDLEQDVCTLWDMSAERDVALFLLSANVLDLIGDIVDRCLNMRMLEMTLGLLGNLACQQDVRIEVAKRYALVHSLIGHLAHPDALCLVQLVRLMRTCLWDLRNSKEASKSSEAESCWIDILTQNLEPSGYTQQTLAFIFGSSTEVDLLCSSLQLLETIVYIKLPGKNEFLGKQFGTKDMIQSLLEGLSELTKNKNDWDDNEQSEEFHIPNDQIEDACKHWVSVLHGLAFCEEGQLNIKEYDDKIIIQLKNIVGHMMDQDGWKDLLHEWSDMLLCISSLAELLMPSAFSTMFFCNLLTILSCLKEQSLLKKEVSEEQGNLEKCLTSLSLCKPVWEDLLRALDQGHAHEVHMYFSAVADRDLILLQRMKTYLQKSSKHPRLLEIASQILTKT